ncbi:DUF1304 domain-containing protein [Microbacterium aurantiacum]|uniref:DUF1304 domain-containing protein n=1 Tax=Microbacterium aurantiacum TaxID=162393 RepID=A0ABT8FNS8_9MICO|nr:DUF1304 domain-containing protein [Microbacterium aurantiacum]MBN9201738.1 DUF1304 domain-containing protein [Microbacterium chocolatum]MDN4462983.1 DUF1304 domain-containing protein [Microbacterium aurantiacum]ODT09420.1 MAG: epimerase [Microbacterium sp. SCN 70-18]
MIAILATVVAALAAALHVLIFVMESIGWSKPRVWRRFGVRDQATADATRPMAYNQGFYNLFLAIGTAVGLVLWWTTDAATTVAGFALVVFSLGSMLAAAVVLVTSGARYLRPALIQGTLPATGLVLTIIAGASAGAAAAAV